MWLEYWYILSAQCWPTGGSVGWHRAFWAMMGGGERELKMALALAYALFLGSQAWRLVFLAQPEQGDWRRLVKSLKADSLLPGIIIGAK